MDPGVAVAVGHEHVSTGADGHIGRMVEGLGFRILCAITGQDEGDSFSVLYHLAREDGIMLNVEVSAPKANPVIKTVTGVFPGADHYEREIVDLLGFKVEGLAPGFRYPLTDDWPPGQYPLRKDWKLDPSLKTGKIEES